MCLLEWSKVIKHEFRYDFIKIKYDFKSKVLFTNPDSLVYEMSMETLAAIKKCLILVII